MSVRRGNPESGTGIIEPVVIIVSVWFLLWGANKFIPMDAKVRKILNVVVIVVLWFWLLSTFLPLTGFHEIRLGR